MTFIEATTIEAVLEVTIIEAAPPLCTAAEGGDCRLLFVFSLLVTSKLLVFWSFAEEIFVFCWSDEPERKKKNFGVKYYSSVRWFVAHRDSRAKNFPFLYKVDPRADMGV